MGVSVFGETQFLQIVIVLVDCNYCNFVLEPTHRKVGSKPHPHQGDS